jgi:hypothetical protein
VRLNPIKYSGLRISLIKLGLFLLVVSFCGVVLLLNAALAWWLLLILALPAHLVSEWFGEKVFAPKYGWSTAQVGFSLKRIAFGVLLIMGVSALVYLVLKLFQGN